MTRTCPVCARTYPDAVFFCGHDGTITVQDQDPGDFDPRLGKQLGGFVVVARVADGAMGRVFEGRHPATRERVAIKVLHEAVARDEVAVERFKREYESARELDHPYVVDMLEFGETPDGSYFLTMEYLVGEELGRVLGRGAPQPPERVVRVVTQTALALDHAHSFGFIHRDLKPDNIFLTHTEAGDDVRVLDFGSVKLQIETGQKLTAVGTTLGSPFYMSPEQAMGRADVDARSDVFALGAVLYEMLTDRVAFEAPNIAKILVRIMKDQPEPPSELVPGLPPALDRVVARALAKDKAARYPSVRALAEAVLAAYGLEGSVERWAGTSAQEIAATVGAPAPAAVPIVSRAPARRDADVHERETVPPDADGALALQTERAEATQEGEASGERATFRPGSERPAAPEEATTDSGSTSGERPLSGAPSDRPEQAATEDAAAVAAASAAPRPALAAVAHPRAAPPLASVASGSSLAPRALPSAPVSRVPGVSVGPGWAVAWALFAAGVVVGALLASLFR